MQAQTSVYASPQLTSEYSLHSFTISSSYYLLAKWQEGVTLITLTVTIINGSFRITRT